MIGNSGRFTVSQAQVVDGTGVIALQPGASVTIAKGRRWASEIQWQPGGISCALGQAGLAKCMLHSYGLVIRRN